MGVDKKIEDFLSILLDGVDNLGKIVNRLEELIEIMREIERELYRREVRK